MRENREFILPNRECTNIRHYLKYSDYAFAKIVTYKGKSRNHLLEQVESFRMGDKKSDREDDLLDTFCYGIALALGNNKGF